MTSFLGLLRSALLLSWCAHDFLCCKLTAYEAESTRDSIEKKIVATKSGRTVGNVFSIMMLCKNSAAYIVMSGAYSLKLRNS